MNTVIHFFPLLGLQWPSSMAGTIYIRRLAPIPALLLAQHQHPAAGNPCARSLLAFAHPGAKTLAEMEPNISSSADGTSPASLSSVHAQGQLSPITLPLPPSSPGLASASGSGSGTPAAGAEGSLSLPVHGHATP